MQTKYNYFLAYDLPQHIKAGETELTLTLTNTSEHELRNLQVALYSLDESALRVLGQEAQVAELLPDETQTVAFPISPTKTASVYVSVDGWKPKRFFHWESAAVQIKVDRGVASPEDSSVSVPPDEVVRLEATIKSLASKADLTVEFWAQDTKGDCTQLAELNPEPIPKGEQASYAVEFTPQQEGVYTIYARLQGETQQVNHKIARVRVKKPLGDADPNPIPTLPT